MHATDLQFLRFLSSFTCVGSIFWLLLKGFFPFPGVVPTPGPHHEGIPPDFGPPISGSCGSPRERYTENPSEVSFIDTAWVQSFSH